MNSVVTVEEQLERVIEELSALVQLWGANRDAARAFALAKTKAEESLQWLTTARNEEKSS